jgi:hypothetical protein
VHRTLHCAMSGAPAAARKNSFLLCAVRWFTGQLLCAVRCAPDRHCRLSGAPISRFKKRPPARDRARGSLLLPASAPLCLSGGSQHPPATSPLRRPPAIPRRPRAPLLPSSVSSSGSLFPPLCFSLSLCFFGLCHPLVHHFQNLVNSCEIQCNQVVYCVTLYSLNTPAGF